MDDSTVTVWECEEAEGGDNEWEKMLKVLMEDVAPVPAEVGKGTQGVTEDLFDLFIDSSAISADSGRSGDELWSTMNTGSLECDASFSYHFGASDAAEVSEEPQSFRLSSVQDLLEDDNLAFESLPTLDSFDLEEGEVSSPGACSGVDEDRRTSLGSDCEIAPAPSFVKSPNLRSNSYFKEPSPDTVLSKSHVKYNSSGSKDVGTDSGSNSPDLHGDGGSYDDFAGPPTEDASMDDDLKRKMRLMKNRESALQSRLRKKSYIKELEAKCRILESQCAMLHQTLAFTSSQNITLREELTKIKCLNDTGSKSVVMEPAALLSDSLPSESPSLHASQCHLDNWELLVWLCHVLLLTLLEFPPQKPRGGSTRSQFQVKRCLVAAQATIPANMSIRRRFGSSETSVTRRCVCPSNRRKKRSIAIRNGTPRPPYLLVNEGPLVWTPGRHQGFKSKPLLKKGEHLRTRRRRYFSRRAHIGVSHNARL